LTKPVSFAEATTLHTCSPALRRVGAYAVGADGVLVRRSMAEDEELGVASAA
jgi:hypothetical protein